MKQNSSVWIGVLVIVLIIAGILFLTTRTQTNTALPGTNNTTGTSTGTINGGDTNPVTAGGKPIVTTAGFASVSSTTAVVVGTVIPNGANTTYWFEYGPTMTYGFSANTMTADGGYTQLGAAAYITGLKPSTDYYFRIGAQNAYGRVYGGQYKFITAAK